MATVLESIKSVYERVVGEQLYTQLAEKGVFIYKARLSSDRCRFAGRRNDELHSVVNCMQISNMR